MVLRLCCSQPYSELKIISYVLCKVFLYIFSKQIHVDISVLSCGFCGYKNTMPFIYLLDTVFMFTLHFKTAGPTMLKLKGGQSGCQKTVIGPPSFVFSSSDVTLKSE